MQTATDKPTHDIWGKAIWYPTDAPYRVSTTHRSSARLDYGWRHGITKTFATLAEAQAFAATLKAAKVEICYAENAATWQKNGRWKLVSKVVNR